MLSCSSPLLTLFALVDFVLQQEEAQSQEVGRSGALSP